MTASLKENILSLSISERIQLVEDIWNTIRAIPESIELTDDQRNTLDERLAAYHKNPNIGFSWKDIKEKILNE